MMMEMDNKGKRQAILIATMELIAEHGFHGAPAVMIAKRAHVATGSIYTYFENKDALINEVYSEIETWVVTSITSDYIQEMPCKERFFHIAKRLLKYMIENPMVFRFIEQFHNSPYGVAVRRDMLFADKDKTRRTDILNELYEDGKREQVIKDVQLPVFYALAFGSLVNVARDHILGFIELDDPLIDKIVSACWDAVKL
jgi:AcrR family transcriptional regulator